MRNALTLGVILGAVSTALAAVIHDWQTCVPALDTCRSKNAVCCVAMADASTSKHTCRPNTQNCRVSDWATCWAGAVCSSPGAACCVATSDLSTGKMTCRPGKKDCSTRSANPNPGYSMWAGVNSFFLYTLSESDQAEILKNLQALGVRLVRIFVSDIDVGAKGSSSVGSVDVEPSRVGVFNDAILTQIDNLMYRAYQHNIKLNIVFHDRYKVDCTWGCDAYSKQWGAYTRNQNGVTHDVSKWYSSSRFAKQYDQRMLHIIDHVNPHFGKAWKHLPDAIFGFGIQNEGQAHSPIGDPNWICARAKALKPHLSPGINVITGGGGDVGDSTLPNHFACPSIDIVAVHSYDAAAWSGAAFIRAVETAIHAKKRLFVEEFGAQDFEGGRAGSLASQIRQIVDAGVPFIPWQLMKPGTTDFEFYTNTEETWSAFVDGVGLAKSAKNGWFSWPEFGIAAQSPEVEFANQDSL